MAKKKDQATGSAIAAGGAVTAGAGVAGGGIPGAKSDADKLAAWKAAGGDTGGRVRRAASTARAKAPAVKAAPGGVFGWRTAAHVGANEKFKAKATKGAKNLANQNVARHFSQGLNEGRIAPEEKIIRHMKGGRRAAGVALIGGTAATGYGLKQLTQGSREKVKKSERHSDRYHGALVGGGATAAAMGAGGSKLLGSQGKKWAQRADRSGAEAKKLAPKMEGRTNTEGMRNPHLLGDAKTARKVGQLRAAAGQQDYFAQSYKANAKMVGRLRTPGLVVAGLGAGGLATSRMKDKKIKKRDLMSDTELRRRKKLQGHISQTTSTLGLGGLGITGAAALAARKPGVLKQVKRIPGLKNTTPEKMKNTAINTGIVSGGIGGIGGYNFAAYTNAESRKRKQPGTVGKNMGIEMGYFGEEGCQLTLPEIEVAFEKAWEPTASNFDSERSRKKRSKVYEDSALVGAGAASTYAGYQGKKAVGHARQIKSVPEASPTTTVMTEVKNRGGKGKHTRTTPKITGASFKALTAEPTVGALKHGGKAALGIGATGAALGAHHAIKRKRKSDWQPYAKRDAVSAFGVDHLMGSGESTW